MEPFATLDSIASPLNHLKSRCSVSGQRDYRTFGGFAGWVHGIIIIKVWNGFLGMNVGDWTDPSLRKPYHLRTVMQLPFTPRACHAHEQQLGLLSILLSLCFLSLAERL